MTRAEATAVILAARPGRAIAQLGRDKCPGYFDVYWFATLSDGARVWFEESERIVCDSLLADVEPNPEA